MSSRATDRTKPPSSHPPSQERRGDPRLPLHLPALLGLGESVLRACVIRSYSDGGLWLDIDRMESEPLAADGRRWTRGDHVKVCFSSDVTGMDMEFEAMARIVRTTSRGIGVAFTERGSQAVNALREQALVYQDNLARRRPKAARPAPVRDLRDIGENAGRGPELFATCREITASFLDERLSTLFDEAKEKLFGGA